MILFKSANMQIVITPSFWYVLIGVIPLHTTTRPVISALTILDPFVLYYIKLISSLCTADSSFAVRVSSDHNVIVPKLYTTKSTILPSNSQLWLNRMPCYCSRFLITSQFIIEFLPLIIIQHHSRYCTDSYRGTYSTMWYRHHCYGFIFYWNCMFAQNWHF